MWIAPKHPISASRSRLRWLMVTTLILVVIGGCRGAAGSQSQPVGSEARTGQVDLGAFLLSATPDWRLDTTRMVLPDVEDTDSLAGLLAEGETLHRDGAVLLVRGLDAERLDRYCARARAFFEAGYVGEPIFHNPVHWRIMTDMFAIEATEAGHFSGLMQDYRLQKGSFSADDGRVQTAGAPQAAPCQRLRLWQQLHEDPRVERVEPVWRRIAVTPMNGTTGSVQER